VIDLTINLFSISERLVVVFGLTHLSQHKLQEAASEAEFAQDIILIGAGILFRFFSFKMLCEIIFYVNKFSAFDQYKK